LAAARKSLVGHNFYKRLVRFCNFDILACEEALQAREGLGMLRKIFWWLPQPPVLELVWADRPIQSPSFNLRIR
jgi:hypothetical protein